MSSVRADKAAISIDQALKILISAHKKDPVALKELTRLQHFGVKNISDQQLLKKWLQSPVLDSDTAPLQLVLKGNGFFKHDKRALPKSAEKSGNAPEEKKGWDLTPFSMTECLQALKNGKRLLPMDAEFTILRYGLRSEFEMAELAEATGETNILKLATHSLQRLAHFETAAWVETELACQSDDDFLRIVQELYRSKIKPLMKSHRDLQGRCVQQARELAVQALIDREQDLPYSKLAKQIYEVVQRRYTSGQYKPGSFLELETSSADEAVTEITLRALSDQIYKDLALAEVIRLIEPVLQECLKDQTLGYQALSLHRGSERHTFMLSGAPACGKGTIAALVASYAEEEFGIQWQDVAKINTDVHRLVVSHERILGEEKALGAHLNGEEATLITQRAQARIQAKIQSGRTPHVLFDGANPAVDRMEMGTAEKGSMHLFVVTAPVSVSMERAYQRGLSTGRYVMTRFMLNAHKTVSEQLFPRLEQFLGKELELYIFDTHVPEGQAPKLLLGGNLQEGKVEIYDPDGLAAFYAKRHIDLATREEQGLFKGKPLEADYGYLDALEELGLDACEIEEILPTMRLPSPKGLG